MSAQYVISSSHRDDAVPARPRGETLTSRFAQQFDLRDDAPGERRELQTFIQHCFVASHGARIEHFMPRLLSLRTKRGDLIAAFGMRSAALGPLFLENYLDAPIETVLGHRFGKAVRREDVIEVGNLSAAHPGATRWLIIAITMLLHREGYKWIAFTGTNVVRNGLFRLGLRPHELAVATLDRLPASEQDQWGNYYQQSPTVMTGEIARGHESLLAHEGLFNLLGSRAETQSMRVLA